MTERPTAPEPESQARPPDGQVLIYRDASSSLQVRVAGRSVWLSQRLIADLFQVSVPTVNEHLSGIYAEGELDRETTVRRFRIVQAEGARQVSRTVDHYNLDAILAASCSHAPAWECRAGALITVPASRSRSVRSQGFQP